MKHIFHCCCSVRDLFPVHVCMHICLLPQGVYRRTPLGWSESNVTHGYGWALVCTGENTPTHTRARAHACVSPPVCVSCIVYGCIHWCVVA